MLLSVLGTIDLPLLAQLDAHRGDRRKDAERGRDEHRQQRLFESSIVASASGVKG